MEEDDGETTTTTTPFWIQTTTTTSRRSRLSSGLLIFTLCLTASIFVLFIISKPILLNKTFDSFNIALLLLVIIFAFLSRNQNRHPTVGSPQHPTVINEVRYEYLDQTDGKLGNQVPYDCPDQIVSKLGNEVRYEYLNRTGSKLGSQVRYDYSDRTSSNIENQVRYDFSDKTSSNIVNEVRYEYLDRTDSKLGNQIRYDYSDRTSSNNIINEVQYEYSDPTAVVGLRAQGSHPDSVSAHSGDTWQFGDDPLVGEQPPEERSKAGKNVYALEEPSRVEEFNGEEKIVNDGFVLRVGDGMARIRGLEEVMAGEIVEFEEGTIGIVQSSESSDGVGVLLMGEGSGIREGTRVKATGAIAQMPVNEAVSDLINEGRGGISALETKQKAPAVRRRKRRTARGVERKKKSREEVASGLEPREEKVGDENEETGGFDRFGTVLRVCDGVARIHGLDEVAAGEVVEFDEGTIGIALDSGFVGNVGVVLMSDGLMIHEGSRVKATGKIAQIPVGKASLGRIVNALAKPIEVEKEVSVSETKQRPPVAPRRSRRPAGSIANNEKKSEEMGGLERPEELGYQKTKRTHEESIVIPKKETRDELEPKDHKSSPPVLSQDATSSRKNGDGNASRNGEEKQRQKSPERNENLLSSKKEKSKKFVMVPPPPLPPLYSVAGRRDAPPAAGAESPLHPVPPPPPPFGMPGWKFVMRGDYVNIGSVNSSRSVSPERDELDSQTSGDVAADVATGGMFCPSPDVNSKADMFIAKFRDGLKLQKMNSLKMKQGVGLSNLGPLSKPVSGSSSSWD